MERSKLARGGQQLGSCDVRQPGGNERRLRPPSLRITSTLLGRSSAVRHPSPDALRSVFGVVRARTRALARFSAPCAAALRRPIAAAGGAGSRTGYDCGGIHVLRVRARRARAVPRGQRRGRRRPRDRRLRRRLLRRGAGPLRARRDSYLSSRVRHPHLSSRAARRFLFVVGTDRGRAARS